MEQVSCHPLGDSTPRLWFRYLFVGQENIDGASNPCGSTCPLDTELPSLSAHFHLIVWHPFQELDKDPRRHNRINVHRRGVSKEYLTIERDELPILKDHGIGLLKKAYLDYSRTPEEIALMKTLRHAMDPQGILNPGKIFEG